jgi:glycerol-3-phosphate acyltransferase PlsY
MGAAGGTAVLGLDLLKGMAAGWLALACAVLAAFDVSEAAVRSVLDGGAPIAFMGIEASGAEQMAALNTRVFGLVQGLGLFGCICGHVFSPWLRFKGGKGVAVAAGCLIVGLGWQYFLVAAGTFVGLTLITRYASVGSVAAAVAVPFLAFGASRGELAYTALALASASLVIWAHRGNIARLRAGTERRIGVKKAEGGEDGGGGQDA